MQSKNVELLLEKYPEARSDDKILYCLYLTEIVNPDDKIFSEYIWDTLPFCAEQASIKRIRAHLQNKKGLYLPDEEVVKQRFRKEKIVREEFSPINNILSWFKKWFK